MLRTFSTTLSLSFLLTGSLYAMTDDDAGELLQRGKPIQLLKGSGDTLEAVLGAGNNVLLKMSMDLNLSKNPVDKEQLEVPVRLFLTDFASSSTPHPAVDLNVKVDWKSAPLTCVLPDRPQVFDSYSQFTDWLSQGYFINKIMIAYDFHIDVQKSAPSLVQHVFSLPTNGYLFHGTHTIESGSIKPDRSVPQVTYTSQRGTANKTTATLKGTFYIKDEPYPIDERQQVFPHPRIEQHEVKRDQTKKFYHHNWLAQSEITTLETYEEFPRNQTNNWTNAPSETYSLLRQKPGDLKEINHIACSDGTTGDSVDISDGKIFLLNAEGINGKDSTHIESIATDKKGKPFIMRYLYAETPKEENLKSLEEEAERAAIATAEEREKEKAEKAKETVKRNIEDLKKKLDDTQNKVDEVKEHLVKVREEEEEHKRSKDYFVLGEKYHNGRGVAQDFTKALKFYYKAAEQGNVLAKYRIGDFYEHARGVTQNYRKAIEWYQKAAEQNHVEAQRRLGVLYSAGNNDVRRDYVKAIEWNEKAAAQNHAPSKSWLLHLNSNPDEQYKTGDSYHNIYRNYAKAMEWYLKAAEQNHAGAQYNLGVLYNNGQGVTKDYVKAMGWHEKAAAQGHVEAQYNLGVLYSSEGVTQDYKKAMEWYEKAAEQNHADAQNWIGTFYHNGRGVTQDFKKAMDWYQKAAEQNHVYAQSNLGLLFYTGPGYGIYKNYVKAIEWYQKAAERNHAAAQFQLGKLYTEEGGTQDFKKAMDWYQKAAAQNHAEAQYVVARSYEHGACSLPKDDKKAKEWYQKAAALGNKDARTALERLEKK